ncbi:flagellar basal body-associated FliL family protein [Acidianus sp. RZ1]|uniref:flagellar basal body-associated FliL family protein n=1 Tax=Acidianus sp. RZ1 TaxID=1540082 RepID=UPI0014923061|nr:flagellar basal body-associated FliL family protein [Acidianus sp. RZ1]NON62407.1 flagellar basal body-associated FliL family protein [Acidianus sp. RZ1]
METRFYREALIRNALAEVLSGKSVKDVLDSGNRERLCSTPKEDLISFGEETMEFILNERRDEERSKKVVEEIEEECRK